MNKIKIQRNRFTNWKLAESEDHNFSYNSNTTSFPKEFKTTWLKLINYLKFLKRNQT